MLTVEAKTAKNENVVTNYTSKNSNEVEAVALFISVLEICEEDYGIPEKMMIKIVKDKNLRSDVTKEKSI